MLGDIIDAFVKSLRKAPVVTKEKIAVRAVTDDGRGIINTVLPCVAVSVNNSTRADVHIGGLMSRRLCDIRRFAPFRRIKGSDDYGQNG